MTRPITNPVTPEMLSLIVDLLPTIGSLRDLCAATGLRLDTVRQVTAPFLAIMKLTGTHPQCGCGRDRFHPYGCADSYAKGKARDWLPGHTREETVALLARREVAIGMLVAGERQKDIDDGLGMTKGGAKNYLRFLTPEQQAARDLALAESLRNRSTRRKAAIARKVAAPKVDPRPFSDPLYARIASAIPRWVTETTRDDIISEMYVAIGEGTLSADDIEANAKKFASSAANLWESKFGPRSLDAPLFEDGGSTLGDMIPDPSALAAFDHIRIGEYA